MDFLSQSLSLFHKGGPVMYFLAVCSLAVVTIAIERFLYYRSVSTDAPAFFTKLQSLLERQRVTEALQLCEQTPSVIGHLASQGLQAFQRGGNVECTLEGVAMLTASRLREYLNYLSAVVTLSPLLGLLGTVIGMINSFNVLNISSGQPTAITGGVAEALVATAAGLSVAVMALVVHVYFSHRLDKLVTDMEEVSSMLINWLPKKKPAWRESHEIA